MATTNNAPQVADKAQVTYLAAGQEVKLSYNIVRNYLTKGNGVVSDQDLMQFISICKFNQLNPFLNEAYLVKFGTQPAQMIVSKEAFLKRADACPSYDGMQSGIIVLMDDKVVELEGGFIPPKAQLVGGWAKVYRSDKKFPTISKVNLSEYDKKQSIWNEKKATMIEKVAQVQALRTAFPSQLGAMYTNEESNVVESEAQVLETTLHKVNEENAEAQKPTPIPAPTEQPPHAPSVEAANEPQMEF